MKKLRPVTLLFVGLVGLAGCSSSPTDTDPLATTGVKETGAAPAQEPAAASSLRYTATPALRQAAVAAYARQQPGSTPATVDQFVAMFGPGGQGDYAPLYTKLLAGSGLHDHDVADAFAAYTVITYRVAHGEAPGGAFLPSGPTRAVRAQYAPLAAKLLADHADSTAAQLGELLKLQAVLVYVGAQQATPTFRQNVARKFQELYRLDVNALTLTDKGLVGPNGAGAPEAPPAADAPGSGVANGAQWFFRSRSDAYGGITFEPVALLPGGWYCDVDDDPLESLDPATDRARRPAAWGRWQRRGATVELTDSDGHVVSYTAGDGSWFPAYAAGALPLHRSYRSSSGGTAGVATSLVLSKIHFVDDSRFTEGQDAGIVSPNAAGGNRRSTHGTYRLQGHTLTLAYADGRTVRKSFAIGAAGNPARPSNELIFIGGDAYTDE